MKRCWAKSIGGCGDISKEHIVSDSILQEMVTVKGFPWCKDKPTRIPSASLKSKILCERHNNQLSSADSEIKNFVFTFKSYFENSRGYDANPSRFTRLPIRHSIDGILLERWFCKTLMNVATLNSSDAEIPVDSILPYIFQGRRFAKPYGLNFAVKTGNSISTQHDSIAITPEFHGEDGTRKLLAGGLFVFRGFHFVVLFPTSINPIEDNTLPLSEGNKEWEGMHLNWHNKEITEYRQGRTMRTLLQVVTFAWE
jgi:hypothetical protein